MPFTSRRSFLQKVAVGSTAAAIASAPRRSHAAGANERITVGLIGCGGQGSSLARSFSELGDIAYVCDPDEPRRSQLQQKTNAPHAVNDLRRILDDDDVDAVVVATPDHWHAPIAILACTAGKHVYVEKPQSHNFRESRLLLDAARRHNVVVQHGTQSRSRRLIADGIQMLREGLIGDVLIAKAWNIQRRGSIGRQRPSDPPAGLNYDTWVGPAEMVPFQKNRLHYNWRWWHNFGTGDIGNDGTHEIDYARWGLGVEGLPSRAVAMGGKYFFDDDQQFPDTASCTFEWSDHGKPENPKQLIFEMRLWSKNYPFNCDSGAEFYGTTGRMMLSKRGKLEVYGERNQRVEDPQPQNPPQLVTNHQADFLSAIRDGRRPNADVAIGHDSVALVHLANVAIKTKRSLQINTRDEQIVGDPQANQLLSRTYRGGGHWAIPEGV